MFNLERVYEIPVMMTAPMVAIPAPPIPEIARPRIIFHICTESPLFQDISIVLRPGRGG